ncbi:MAG: glycosyltransferase family 4 protein [Nitrososphaerota archaeon]|jgi:glycosyltransferase involved in cell wall biosynthesis|nr:glycosyltransferase family 4 protein [Nitrososphaerota archaeon]MDG6928053.1 glycosyltransferase family 4 protein [Nitrososphaerota archaeon]MDG6930322.1 glycosyltransferase family 4 protein [Nitrososphaerota archaeon]MDG6931995.1 glycosyltransferase family 4 protein [Nitrososphaerota archaeon]MDG6936701.1 glycosyltransferase family 4 protein [Nitrososphaerota archaeon]
MISLTVNTQTPPVKINLTFQQLVEKYGELDMPIDLGQLNPEDIQTTVGGVSRMIMQLADRLGLNPIWVSLGPGYPPEAIYKNVKISFVDLDPENLNRFTRFKEGLYTASHGLSHYKFNPKDYIGYTIYNWNSAKILMEKFDKTDVYFINDFQQLLVGGLIGPSAPAVLWYHIPMVPENLNPENRGFVRRSLDGFDTVILSTKRDLEGVVRLGSRVKVKQIYPFIDPDSLNPPGRHVAQRVSDKLGLKGEDKKILLVGRMDPIKSQDIAISAIRGINAKLILVGNGSFTSTSLGHDKASTWAKTLKELARKEGVEDKVVFAGYLPDEELNALYETCDAVILPSRIEGFGLSVCEGWKFKKPVVVSKGAGISELILDGVNGFTFDAGNAEGLKDSINKALDAKPEMGEMGYTTLDQWCSLRANSEKIEQVMEEAYYSYKPRTSP